MKKTILVILGIFACSVVFSAVEFMSFQAEVRDAHVLLSWSTASETANLGFVLERKTDSLAVWSPLAAYLNSDELLGQGTVSNQSDYSYTDTSVIENITYFYRLSGVDEANNMGLLDSLFITVSETDLQTILPNKFTIRVFPNPFNARISVHCSLPRDAFVDMSIYDMQGKRVARIVRGYMDRGNHALSWNAGGMDSGLYVLKTVFDNVVQTQKIVLLK